MTRGNAIFFLSRTISLLTTIHQISWHQLCDVGRSDQFRRRSNDHPQFQGMGIRPQYSSMEPPCIMATSPSSTAVIKIGWAAAELASLIKNPRSLPCFHPPRTQYKFWLTAFCLDFSMYFNRVQNYCLPFTTGTTSRRRDVSLEFKGSNSDLILSIAKRTGHQ